MNTLASLDDVVGALKAAQRIAVVSHYNPDADAYGSSLGLFHSLRSVGKDVVCVNETPSSGRYDFLPGVRDVIQIAPDSAELLVVCDCGSFSRVGDSLKGPLSGYSRSINVDHHSSNDMFSTLNLVRVEASSTSEIVFEILEHGGFPLTEPVATCLLAGLVGDTGSFRYSSTSASTFGIAERLVRAGASPVAVGQGLFGNTPVSAVRIQSEAMLGMTLHFGGKLAEAVVPADAISRHGGSLEDVEGVAERLRDVEGVLVGVCIRQDVGIWRISLRSRTPTINVAAVAQAFGGGGHVQAAAFRWPKGLDDLRRRLLEKFAEVLK